MRYGEHDWKTFEPNASIKVGRIEVIPLPADHSVPHAFGFLVRTSAGTIVYTGDFRQHGPRASATREFLTRAAAEEASGLIIEGTRARTSPRLGFAAGSMRSFVGPRTWRSRPAIRGTSIG
jgi:mRNA degradation ribonuclease J1/J2